jgi:hypothetical protein
MPATFTNHRLPVKLRVPTVDLTTARAVLGCAEGELRAFIEVGKVPWAWNIARRLSGRIELRILAACLQDLQIGYMVERSIETVAELIHGPRTEAIYGPEWHRAWNADSGHMGNLVKDGTLRLLPGSQDCRRGPGGSYQITWASAVEFIRARRLVTKTETLTDSVRPCTRRQVRPLPGCPPARKIKMQASARVLQGGLAIEARKGERCNAARQLPLPDYHPFRPTRR